MKETTMNRSIRQAIVPALIALTLFGCARRAQMPPVNVGYEELRETFTGVDFSPLEGRRILLDPGHGGVFPGVVGRDGLSEADVNLGVSLYLRGLLEAAGARVWMTRTTDRDFVSPADSSLAVDLAARVAMCDTLRPDVFLTLHHNSNAALDRDMNETQTYYPVGRDGADLDLARAIHRHLVRNLDIRPAKIMAGNFYVLRNAPQGVPAVLGEPSMLSNPHVEEKLMTAEKMELEAQAYFLGLQEYFAGGTPRWAAVDESSDWWPSYGKRWRFEPGENGPELDPDAIKLTIDGAPAPATYDASARTVVWLPGRPLVRSGSVLELTGRNLAGRTMPAFFDTLDGTTHIFEFRVETVHEHEDTGPDRAQLVRWEARDRTGNTVAIDSPLWIGEVDAARSDGILLTEGGDRAGSALVPMSAWSDIEFLNSGRGSFPSGSYRVRQIRWGLLPGSRWVVLDDGSGSGRRLPESPWTLRHHSRSGQPKPPPTIRTEVADRSLPYVPIAADDTVWLERQGYRPIARTPADAWQDTLTWHPVAPHLIGRTIILDPAGGGPDDQGLAPMGTPGRELNLRVAERLATLLRGAGANPILTRADAGWVPKEHKVLTTNREHGALFLTIARASDSDSLRLFHHYGSRNGERWARLTAAALTDAEATAAPVGPSYAYLLRHTAPPALRLELPMPVTEDAEDVARTPAAQQAEALALFRAVAAYFEGEADLPAGWDLRSFMTRHRTALPHPDDVDLVRVDGSWLWLPPVAGAPAALLPPAAGPRMLEVRSGDQWWLMEADPTADTLHRLLHGIGNRVLTPEQSEPPRPEVLHAPERD